LLSEITLLFDLSLNLDRTLAQQKAKSKLVTQCEAVYQSACITSRYGVWTSIFRTLNL